MKNWKVLLPLFMVIFVDVMGLCIVFPVFAPLFFDPETAILPAGLSVFGRNLFYGLMLSLWPIFLFIFSPIIGDLSDRWGRKKVLLLCLFGEALAYLLGAIAVSTSSLVIFLVSRILAGTFSGSQPIAQAAIADISTPENKTRNMSYIVLAGTLGIVLGPLIGGLTSDTHLIAWFSLATPFQLAALISLLNGVLLLATFKETYQPQEKRAIVWSKSLFLIVSAFKQKHLRFLSWAFLCVQLAWSLYFQALAFFLLQHFHFSTAHLGIFYGVIGLASSTALIYGIKILTKRLRSDRHIFVVGSLLLMLGGMMAFMANSLVWQYVAVVCNAFGISFVYTIGITLYSNSVSADKQGWVMGVAAALCGLAWAVTAIMTAALSALSPILPFFITVLLAASSLLFIYSKHIQAKRVDAA